jgi:hypothetical protein
MKPISWSICKGIMAVCQSLKVILMSLQVFGQRGLGADVPFLFCFFFLFICI